MVIRESRGRGGKRMSSSNARRMDEWTRVGSGEGQSERSEVVSAYAQRPRKPTDSATAGTIGLLLCGLFGLQTLQH